ncbi:MAG: lipoprotein NlpI [Shewanellaceae bacterium]|nr:lipoprotein NlpI [Shewanellaceae bacterium]
MQSMKALLPIVVLILSACSSIPSSQQTILVAPAEVNYRVELTLAKLNEYLASGKLSQAERVRFLYDRGVLYDSVGLKTLARIDFHHALKLQPNFVDAYNFLGIYYTQDQAFGRAFEAFDTVLELQPTYQYVYLNRGLASYYNDRFDLAAKDFNHFYELNPKDGYRILWLYIVAAATDEVLARQQLIEQRAQLDDAHWDAQLIDLVLGKIDYQQLFVVSSIQLTYRNEMAERMCEVYFYAGKVAQIQGDHHRAMDYFKLALSTNVHDFVEHRYARLELQKSLSALR